MIYAFNDSADGYYQVDVADGEPMPAWTIGLTPCAVLPVPTPTITIPDVTPRQIRMALSRAGLRTLVESAVAAGNQDLKDWYEFSTTFQRSQPLVVQMGVDLGQTPEQLDALWVLAATL